MIEVIDKIVNKKNQEILFVKMDVITYDKIVKQNSDITIWLHNMENDIKKSKWFNNLDDLFDDLEK